MELGSLDAAIGVFHLFGDRTRVRLVALLSGRELTVAELTSITGLAQSRVSTHLGKLREAGVLRDRRVGASTLYSVNDGAIPAEARRVWTLIEKEIRDTVLDADRERCEALIRAREAALPWPEALAGRMERHYSPGRTWEATARAFLGLVRLGDVLDVGSGDGTIAELVAPRARTITCLDRSEKMLAAARARLSRTPNVRFSRGDVQQIPFADRRFDHVLLLNVLTHAQAPARALAEVARVLRRGGGLTLVTLEAHEHAEVTAAYAHLHAGFRASTLRRWIEKAGLDVERCEVTSRERREPYFNVVTAFARKEAP